MHTAQPMAGNYDESQRAMHHRGNKTRRKSRSWSIGIVSGYEGKCKNHSDNYYSKIRINTASDSFILRICGRKNTPTHNAKLKVVSLEIQFAHFHLFHSTMIRCSLRRDIHRVSNQFRWRCIRTTSTSNFNDNFHFYLFLLLSLAVCSHFDGKNEFVRNLFSKSNQA